MNNTYPLNEKITGTEAVVWIALGVWIKLGKIKPHRRHKYLNKLQYKSEFTGNELKEKSQTAWLNLHHVIDKGQIDLWSNGIAIPKDALKGQDLRFDEWDNIIYNVDIINGPVSLTISYLKGQGPKAEYKEISVLKREIERLFPRQKINQVHESPKPASDTIPNFGWVKLSVAFERCETELGFSPQQTWDLLKRAWENEYLGIRGRGQPNHKSDDYSLIYLKAEWVSRIVTWGPSSNSYTTEDGILVQEFRESSDLPTVDGGCNIIWFNQTLDMPSRVFETEVKEVDLKNIIRLTKGQPQERGNDAAIVIEYSRERIGFWTALNIINKEADLTGGAALGIITLLENCAKNGEIKVYGNKANSAMLTEISSLEWESLRVNPIAQESSDGHEYSEASAHPENVLAKDYGRNCWYNLRYNTNEIIAIRDRYFKDTETVKNTSKPAKGKGGRKKGDGSLEALDAPFVLYAQSQWPNHAPHRAATFLVTQHGDQLEGAGTTDNDSLVRRLRERIKKYRNGKLDLNGFKPFSPI